MAGDTNTTRVSTLGANRDFSLKVVSGPTDCPCQIGPIAVEQTTDQGGDDFSPPGVWLLSVVPVPSSRTLLRLWFCMIAFALFFLVGLIPFILLVRSSISIPPDIPDDIRFPWSRLMSLLASGRR